MNNSFSRIIDGMCATLRAEVLTRLTDEFARGQVFGVINALNTFKTRADWSSGFLIEQLTAQNAALKGILSIARSLGIDNTLPLKDAGEVPTPLPISELLAARDRGNAQLTELLSWVEDQRTALGDRASEVDRFLKEAIGAEARIELKHSPRPLFAEMSSGRED